MLMEYAIFGRGKLSGRLFDYGAYNPDEDDSPDKLCDALEKEHGRENIGVTARPCDETCETGK